MKIVIFLGGSEFFSPLLDGGGFAKQGIKKYSPDTKPNACDKFSFHYPIDNQVVYLHVQYQHSRCPFMQDQLSIWINMFIYKLFHLLFLVF
jgi:hypothetical protein